jgi:hypothetical protein
MILLDNTALSAFAHIDRLDLPSKLFGEAFIPESVYYEGLRYLFVAGNFIKPFYPLSFSYFLDRFSKHICRFFILCFF